MDKNYLHRNRLCFGEQELAVFRNTGGGNAFYKKIGYEDGIHWLHYKK